MNCDPMHWLRNLYILVWFVPITLCQIHAHMGSRMGITILPIRSWLISPKRNLRQLKTIRYCFGVDNHFLLLALLPLDFVLHRIIILSNA
ncbi:hypothetical protein BLOT_015914 [Blomia tropicalis]|nr:hypothetical protein BLOT_015914 [Blomia tropicalis]